MNASLAVRPAAHRLRTPHVIDANGSQLWVMLPSIHPTTLFHRSSPLSDPSVVARLRHNVDAAAAVLRADATDEQLHHTLGVFGPTHREDAPPHLARDTHVRAQLALLDLAATHLAHKRDGRGPKDDAELLQWLALVGQNLENRCRQDPFVIYASALSRFEFLRAVEPGSSVHPALHVSFDPPAATEPSPDAADRRMHALCLATVIHEVLRRSEFRFTPNFSERRDALRVPVSRLAGRVRFVFGESCGPPHPANKTRMELLVGNNIGTGQPIPDEEQHFGILTAESGERLLAMLGLHSSFPAMRRALGAFARQGFATIDIHFRPSSLRDRLRVHEVVADLGPHPLLGLRGQSTAYLLTEPELYGSPFAEQSAVERWRTAREAG